jgi:hypothetical protein
MMKELEKMRGINSITAFSAAKVPRMLDEEGQVRPGSVGVRTQPQGTYWVRF